jgi:sugar phosphate isomerase/epimerase
MAHLATVAAFGFPDFDPPIILDLYKRLGCVSCQFYRNEANPPQVRDVVRIASDVGLPIDSIHGVFGQQYDPSSPDATLRASSVETYRQEGELALKLGGPMVVVHPAPIYAPDRKISGTDRAARIDPMLESMGQLAEMGEELGVVYLIENLTDHAPFGNDPLQLAQMIREIDSPFVRMCFDTGHALCTGEVAGRLAACADVISYLHIHDNDGVSDSHLMPGDGRTPWEQVGQTIAECGLGVPAMLEVFYLKDRVEQSVISGLGTKLQRWIGAGARTPLNR